jgi:Cell Wall Hydrolase
MIKYGTPQVMALALCLLTPAARANALGDTAEFDVALKCMTTAIYYEAAFEPTDGQEAVAQVILNRVRHKDYPKSICGVIYQGSTRRTGCQFSFTCDNSLARAPRFEPWERAADVARRALLGEVISPVGNATHYHASYVSPYWRNSLNAAGRIGAHLFYFGSNVSQKLQPLLDVYAGNESQALTQAALAPARSIASDRSPKTENPALPKNAVFTGWGLQIATVSLKKGALYVRPASTNSPQ